MPLTKQQKQSLIGAAVFLVAGSVLYVKFFWLPISRSKDELSEKIVQIDTKIAKAEGQASRLKRLQDELVKLNQDAVEAERRLPKTKSVPDVLITLSSLAEKSRVAIKGFSPGGQKGQQYFTELSYPMTVKGGYHDIGRFLAAIALEERIFNVRDVVYPAAGTDGQMTVSFILLTYQYKG